MKIEILFPELCNLYGDIQNITYLKQCIPEAELIQTSFEEEPAFVSQQIDFLYLGCMKERTQEQVIKKLQPYKQRLEELIQNSTVILFTGNALEIVGKYIENEDGSRIEALGIFDTYAKRDMLHRYNGLVLGKANDIEIVGFKATFSLSYGNNENEYFFPVEKGIGINKESKLEGIRKNNFIGTYLIGPFLILNPLFTKYLLTLMGVKEPKLAFEQISMEAYEKRLEEFKKPHIH